MRECDIAIVGGGSAGFGTAVSAGRSGMDVVLIEGSDVLGGVATTGLVCNWTNAYWDGERFVIGGIFGELRYRLIGSGGIYQTHGPHHRDKFDYESFNPEILAKEMEVMAAESNVELLLGDYVTGIELDGGDISSLSLENGTTIQPQVVIDATGDAIVANETGVPSTVGTEGDSRVQPATFCYIIGPLDIGELKSEHPESIMFDEKTGEEFAALGTALGQNSWLQEKLDEARERGAFNPNAVSIPSVKSIPSEPQNLAVNFDYVELDDPLDQKEREEALEEGRHRMHAAVEFFRENIPGMQNIEVVEEAEKLGVRESRQIVGQQRLIEDDVLECRQFDEVIAQCCFGLDEHRQDDEIHFIELPKGKHYDVPWGTIVPREGPQNLVVAGRCLSAGHYAMSSVRQMASVIAIGEAAGVTAALAAEEDNVISDVNYRNVQEILNDRGVILS